MVDFVDVFVEGTPVEGSVGPVVPCVFEDEEDGDLVGDCEEGREGDAGREAEVLSHWVEKPGGGLAFVIDGYCLLCESS